MSLLKKSLIAPSLAILLATNLYSANYTVDTTNATKAIEKISELSNIPFIVDTNILNGKNTNKIHNVQNLDEALKLMFEGTGLEAVVKNNTIVIKKIEGKGTVLEPISVNESYKNGTAENGYLVEDVKTLGVWGNLSLQDTPYSMSIIPQEFLENTITTDFKEIAKRNPVLQDTGVGVHSNGGINTKMRGFGVSSILTDGIPLNGVYYGNGVEETDRIEVISGLSGFLYGAGNVGGTINYVLKRPTATPFTKVSIGNNGGQNYYTSIDTSQNITDKLSVRVNGLYEDGDKVKENSSRENKYIGIALDYKATDDLLLGLFYSHREFKENGSANWRITGTRPDASFFDNKKAYAPDWTYVGNDSDKVELKTEYNFTDNIKLRSAYIHLDSDMNRLQNYNYANINANQYGVSVSDSRKQEGKYDAGYLYLDNNFALGSTQHFLTYGASFGIDRYYIKGLWDTSHGYSYSTSYKLSSLDDYMNFRLGDVQSSNPEKANYKMRDNINKNLVIGDNITFSEQWSALVGANYATIDNKSYSSNGKLSGNYDESKLTPTLSLIYKPIEDLTTYVTYIEALENGSVVGSSYANAGDILDPYISTQYEVGAKYSVNKDLLLSTALFRIEKQNSYADTTSNRLTQDGQQINEGIEILATGKATDNLTLMGGFTYVKPEVEKATNKATEGKESTNVAKYQAKMYAEYKLPVSPKIFLNGGVYYTGTQWVDTLNTEKLPAYTLADIGARYETKLENKYDTTFRIYVSNLLDKEYWANNFNLGDPRTIGFSATIKF